MAKEIKINKRLIIDGKEQGCDLCLYLFGHFLLKKIKSANVFLQTKNPPKGVNFSDFMHIFAIC